MQLSIYKTEKNEYSILIEQKNISFEQMCNYQIQVLEIAYFLYRMYIVCIFYISKYPHGINSNYVAFAR